MADRSKVEKSYPHLFDTKLPLWLGCPKVHSTELAKQAFKKVCFKDVIITEVKGVEANCKPVCIWRVYYKKKNEQLSDEEEDHSNILPGELPKDEGLKQFFQDITKKCYLIDVEVLRKYKIEPHAAIVEYFPKECECEVKHFNMTTEVPRMWPIKEAEVNLCNLQIHNMGV